jgi:hypothetical protein
MGKGSAPRPYSVDTDTFESNWDKIFKKKKNSDDVSPHTLEYEYELNKSTGNVEKRFIDGTSKPNESQFNGK